MGQPHIGYFIGSIWSVLLIFAGVIAVCSCICSCYQYCPWHKSRHQGTVYRNITLPSGRVEVTTTHNPTGYPITQQVTLTPNTIAYPVQQTAYPVQHIGPVQPGVAGYPPPTNYVPAMPHPGASAMPQPGAPAMPGAPYDQPPPYSEVASMPGHSVPEAYAKQAPFNPYYGSNDP